MLSLIRQSKMHFLAGGILASMLFACGSPSPSGPEAAQEGGRLNTLTGVNVNDEGSRTVVEIAATGELAPNVFKLTDPLRVIVDFTDTQIGDLQSPLAVNNGTINEITLTQFDDISSSLSRVVIGFDKLADYQVNTKGNALAIEINKSAAFADSGSDAIDDTFSNTDLGDGMAAPPADDTFAGEDQFTNNFEDIAVAEMTEPAIPGTDLLDIQTSNEGDRTRISLNANGSIPNFEDFVLENPKRLVVDLQGLSYKGSKNISVADGLITKIRTGSHPDKVRVVFDFASGSSPDYSINAASSGLEVVIGSQGVGGDLLAQGDPLMAPPSGSSGELLASIDELPLEQIPVEGGDEVAAETESAVMEAPVEEAAPLDSFLDPEPIAEPVVDEPMMAEPLAPMASSGPYRVQSIDFVQIQGKSRLMIKTSEPAAHTATAEGSDTIILNLENASISRALSRYIDTSAFNSPVTRIVPKQVGKDTRIVTTLRDAVPFQVSQDGNYLYVDFDRSKDYGGMELPAAPESSQEVAEVPMEETSPLETLPDEMAEPGLPEEVTEAPALPEEVAEAPAAPAEEPMVDESIFDAEFEEPQEEVSYEYVKEELLSDKLNKEGETGGGFGDDMIFELAPSSKKYTGRKINLDFKDADIRSLFRLFADISKLNIIVGDDVNGKVTIRLRDVPWDQAFAILLQTQSLGALKYGNIIRIAPADKIQKERELHTQAKKAAIAAAPMDTLFKSVSYASPNDLLVHVQSTLSERGTVNIDTRTNTLIVRDVREKLIEAKSLIEKLDAQTPQVTIEARIVEVNDTFVRNWGVQWGASAEFSAGTGNPTGLLFPNSIGAVGSQSGNGVAGGSDGNPVLLNFPPQGANSSVTLNLGSINNVLDLDLLLGYEESEGNAKLVSSPKVTVLDNEAATILSGTRIPFITQTANAGNNVRFESAVISISVTPHITADGAVIMDVQATRNEPDFGQAVLGNPSIIQREAQTKVLVKSGNTTVIGGVYRVNRTRNTSGFPLLRKIPLIKWLFSNDNRRLERQELLIFVTPRIVGDERTVIRQVQG